MQATSSSCSGSGSPDVSQPRCYLGSKIFGVGETVAVTIDDFNVQTGHLHLSGSGATGFTCSSHEFKKSGQDVSTDLSDCLPNGVVVEGVKYCSDQDTIEVMVNDKNIPFNLGKLTVEAKHVDCNGNDDIMVNV